LGPVSQLLAQVFLQFVAQGALALTPLSKVLEEERCTLDPFTGPKDAFRDTFWLCGMRFDVRVFPYSRAPIFFFSNNYRFRESVGVAPLHFPSYMWKGFFGFRVGSVLQLDQLTSVCVAPSIIVHVWIGVFEIFTFDNFLLLLHIQLPNFFADAFESVCRSELVPLSVYVFPFYVRVCPGQVSKC
jgi:hypothetical protein